MQGAVGEVQEYRGDAKSTSWQSPRRQQIASLVSAQDKFSTTVRGLRLSGVDCAIRFCPHQWMRVLRYLCRSVVLELGSSF
jgi:hypothetical protein